jgi:asparagine synthase (glutamine-hydrolysing)
MLSGGLDSSLVSAIAAKETNDLNTFSIGLEGSDSPDLKFAKIVANYIGSKHHEVTFTFEEGFAAIPEVIRILETYDTTTIRASTPMYLLSKWIRQNTDIKVILSGEGSDELFGGYLYFHDAPNEIRHKEESKRLLNDIYLFDALRSDRSTAAWGLEVRVPFLDLDFTEYILNEVNNYYPKRSRKIEKYKLRQAFSESNYLPDECLWRQKDAFSDAVGYN